MKSLNLKLIFLVLILLMAFFLRAYKVSDIPPSLNWDEVSHGYNAYSILKTGKDEWGVKLPLIFRCYGDYKLPLYIYLTTPLVAIFGLNAFSVRLVSVLAGLGLVLVAYLITRKLTKDEVLSFLSAFLVSVSPWSLFLSRVAVEANLVAFLFALGMYFLVLWPESFKQKYLIFLSLTWGLSLYAYNSARVLVPLFILFLIFLAFKKRKAGQLPIFVLLALIFLIPVIFQFLNRSARARLEWVSLIDQGTINRIEEKRTASSLPKTVSAVLYNKATFFGYYGFRNYLTNFSPKYLFFQGGSHYQFSLPNRELLYLVTAPFLILGLWQAFKGEVTKKVIFFWFILAFIPSAITKDAPHVLRSILVLPSPMILTCLGLKFVVDFLKERSIFRGKLLILVFLIGVLISFKGWWGDYFNSYPKNYSWAWQYGYKQTVLFIKENYLRYDKIIFTKRYGEPHEFVLFYWPWEPFRYQNETKIWDYHANWYWIDGFDKFEFVNDWEVKNRVKERESKRAGGEKYLLVTSPGNYPEGWEKIKTINFQDGKPVFEILESNL